MSHSHVVETSGVPQLAETRIANDGNPYTLAQFESHYNEMADWYWQRAARPTQEPTVPPPVTADAISGASDGVHLASDVYAFLALPPPAPLAIPGADDGVHLASDGGALPALSVTNKIPPIGLAVPPPATAVAISGASDGVHLASDDGAHLAGDVAALIAVYTLQ